MRPMMWMRHLGLLACLAMGPASAVAGEGRACRLQPADRLWIEKALGNWRWAETNLLHLPAVPMPEVVAVDATCQANAVPQTGAPIRWRGRLHHGKLTMPDGNSAPVGVMSFAGPDPKNPRGFFVMSMPSVWRKGGVTSELGLETLMDGVLLHEMMHTRQFAFANPAMAALSKHYGLPEGINDDSIQAAFKDDPAYVGAWQAETDLLYAAAAAPTDAEARRLARKALTAMRARHAMWFVGPGEKWKPLDDIFLQMEGLGQWLIYKYYVDGPNRVYPPGVALKAVRRGRKQWSQDEGLALMLVVDRLVPDWQNAAFAAQPMLAEALLAKAAA
jgi:hypothetical protein